MIKINFQSKLFNEESHQKIADELNNEILKLNLNLNSLNQINITENLLKSVLKFQEHYSKKEKGVTQGENGDAIAKVMDFIDENDQFAQEIFITDWVIFNLFQEDKNIAARSFHILHHELVHIHDKYLKKRIYTLEGRQAINRNRLDHILTIHADIVWSEFIAERLSWHTLTFEDIPYKVDHVKSLLQNVKSEIEKQIKGEEDHNYIFRVLQEETSLLLKIVANLFGMLDGLISNATEHENINLFQKLLINTFENSCMEDIWEDFYNNLVSLFKIYPDWNDVNELSDLCKTIRAFWASLGVYTNKSDDENNFYIYIR
ncbi:hypothetical protein [Bacillus sp. FJAT-29937]|uniref:hypothetical protein n=1 Tax=Bacillus sp. FJAT-29937 TaxID=1720553 RepID=UPI00082E2628|nr:hypothetical protein [Bacillus sp. FJAT-29937]